MAKSHLGLEITSTKIRYVVLDPEAKKLKVLKSGDVSHKLDITAKGAFTKTIQEICSQQKISPKMIFLTIARQDTLVREIVIPKMSPLEISEVLSGEIEKLPAFSSRPFEYTYQKYLSGKEKSRIVYAALDKELLNYLLSETKKTKIPFQYLDVAPLNLKELIYQIGPAGKNDALLVVNDKVSYFLIFRDHEYKLFYKTTTGSDELFFPGTLHPNTGIFANFAAELQRVVKSYLLENKNENLDHLWLVYDQVAAPKFEEQIHDKLAMKFDVLTFRNLPGIDVVDEASNNSIFLVAATPVIYFLRKLKAQFPFNHFFRGGQAQKGIAKALVLTVVYLAAVIFIVGGLAQNYGNQEQNLARQNSQLAQKISQLKKEADDLTIEYNEYFRIRQGLLDQATYVQLLNRVSWSEVLAIVAERMPEDLSLTSFKLSEQGRATFNGESLKMETVAELIRRVDVSSILESGKFDSLNEKIVEKQKIFGYGISAQLKSLSPKKDAAPAPAPAAVKNEQQANP